MAPCPPVGELRFNHIYYFAESDVSSILIITQLLNKPDTFSKELFIKDKAVPPEFPHRGIGGLFPQKELQHKKQHHANYHQQYIITNLATLQPAHLTAAIIH